MALVRVAPRMWGHEVDGGKRLSVAMPIFVSGLSSCHVTLGVVHWLAWNLRSELRK